MLRHSDFAVKDRFADKLSAPCLYNVDIKALTGSLAEANTDGLDSIRRHLLRCFCTLITDALHCRRRTAGLDDYSQIFVSAVAHESV